MNIERPRNLQNASAISRIHIVDVSDIHTITIAGNQVLDVTLKPTREWSYIYFTDFTSSYSEVATTTVNGRVYRYDIQGFYPTDTEELRQFLAVSEMRKFVIAVRDVHGVVRIVGNKNLGLELDYDSSISAEMGGRRGTQIRLFGELPIPSSIWI